MLLPDTNAFCDILLSNSCCCDGNNADVNIFLDGVSAASVVIVALQLSEIAGDSEAADSSVATNFEIYQELNQVSNECGFAEIRKMTDDFLSVTYQRLPSERHWLILFFAQQFLQQHLSQPPE